MSDTIAEPIEAHIHADPGFFLEPIDRLPVTEEDHELRLYCLMRDDLTNTEGQKVAEGKLHAQSGHAFVDVALQAMALDAITMAIYQNSSRAKIMKRAKNLAALERAARECEAAGINHVVITDEGRTEFGGVPTVTCMGFGPITRKDVPKFIEKMRLY